MQLPFGELVRTWTPNGVCPASPFRLRRLILGCEPREGSNDTNARERPCSSSSSSIFPTNLTERT